MAVDIKDATGVTKTMATRLTGGEHTFYRYTADGDDVTQGAKADAAAGADTGTFSLVAMVKRVMARLTSLLAVLPATLGQKAAAASFPVVLASDDPAVASLGVLDDWDESDRLKANIVVGQAGVAASSGVTTAATVRAVLATDTTVPNVTGNVAAGATDAGNPVKTGGVYRSSAPTLTNGQRGDTLQDVNGNALVSLATQLDPTNDQVAVGAKAAGGATPHTLPSSAASDNATSVKGSAATLYSVQVWNFSLTDVVYLKVYDKATAPNSSDTPKLVIPVAAAVDATHPTAELFSGPAAGTELTAGLGYRLTTDRANAGTTAVASGDVALNLLYK